MSPHNCSTLSSNTNSQATRFNGSFFYTHENLSVRQNDFMCGSLIFLTNSILSLFLVFHWSTQSNPTCFGFPKLTRSDKNISINDLLYLMEYLRIFYFHHILRSSQLQNIWNTFRLLFSIWLSGLCFSSLICFNLALGFLEILVTILPSRWFYNYLCSQCLSH